MSTEWGLPEQQASARNIIALADAREALHKIATWPMPDGNASAGTVIEHLQSVAWGALGGKPRDDADLDVHRMPDGRGA